MSLSVHRDSAFDLSFHDGVLHCLGWIRLKSEHSESDSHSLDIQINTSWGKFGVWMDLYFRVQYTEPQFRCLFGCLGVRVWYAQSVGWSVVHPFFFLKVPKRMCFPEHYRSTKGAMSHLHLRNLLLSKARCGSWKLAWQGVAFWGAL